MKHRFGFRCVSSGAWQNTARYGYLSLDFPSYTHEHGVPSNPCSRP